MSQENLIEYQRKRAVARRIIKYTKKKTWREFCSTTGRGVKLADVWSIFKRLSGKRESVPALVDGKRLADKEKADVLGRAFAALHSGEHLDCAVRENENMREKRVGDVSALDVEFAMSELKVASQGTGFTTPGQDQLCYAMFRQLPVKHRRLSYVLELILERTIHSRHSS